MAREKHQVAYKSWPIHLNKNKTPTTDCWTETIKPGGLRRLYFTFWNTTTANPGYSIYNTVCHNWRRNKKFPWQKWAKAIYDHWAGSVENPWGIFQTEEKPIYKVTGRNRTHMIWNSKGGILGVRGLIRVRVREREREWELDQPKLRMYGKPLWDLTSF